MCLCNKFSITTYCLKREHDCRHARPNSEVADAYKGMEICWKCLSCCWTCLLCCQLFLQSSIWKLNFVENSCLHSFQFHHLLHNFVCKNMANTQLVIDSKLIQRFCLSRQIQCGFEVELMYFYLGCLIVQLMKIKLLLAIVGVCYSYCLIILRSSFSSSNVRQETRCVIGLDERVVIHVDSQQQENPIRGFNIKQQFISCMNELKKNNSNIGKMLLQKVKGNYKLVMTDHNFIIDSLLPETINKLHNTVKLMVDSGFEKECYEIYNSYRKEWLEDLLINKLLALRKMEFQDYMIGRWIKTCKVALRILFNE